MSSKLLLDSQPLIIIPELAIVIGLNESIVLQQVHYWIRINTRAKTNHHDGYTWTYNSYTNWQYQFPFWGIRTIKRIFTALETKKLLVSANYNLLKIDRTKWYRINYENLDILIASAQLIPWCQNGTMHGAKLSPPLPEITKRKKTRKKRRADKTLVHTYNPDNPGMFRPALM